MVQRLVEVRVEGLGFGFWFRVLGSGFWGFRERLKVCGLGLRAGLSPNKTESFFYSPTKTLRLCSSA